MTECRQMRQMLSRYIDGELLEQEKHELERHLKLCPSCRSVLSAYENIAAATAESQKEPPVNFAANVMDAIKKLPVDEKRSVPDKTRRKTIKTVAVTFAAAAACLALVLIASPLLLGKTASTKDASLSAPSFGAAENNEMAQNGDDDSNAVDMATTGDSYALTGEAADAHEEAGGVQPEEPLTIYTTSDAETDQDEASPTPAPILQPEGRGESELLKEYFAVFYLNGQLPDVLEDKNMWASEDGTVTIEITQETANELLENGYRADMGDEDAGKALVVYTP